jgi:hypothetical protein
VYSEIKPVIVGPKKKPAIPITPTLEIATAGAIPGVLLAAKIKAGNMGPIPRPAAMKPIFTMIKAGIGYISDIGIEIAKAIPQILPPI